MYHGPLGTAPSSTGLAHRASSSLARRASSFFANFAFSLDSSFISTVACRAFRLTAHCDFLFIAHRVLRSAAHCTFVHSTSASRFRLLCALRLLTRFEFSPPPSRIALHVSPRVAFSLPKAPGNSLTRFEFCSTPSSIALFVSPRVAFFIYDAPRTTVRCALRRRVSRLSYPCAFLTASHFLRSCPR